MLFQAGNTTLQCGTGLVTLLLWRSLLVTPKLVFALKVITELFTADGF